LIADALLVAISLMAALLADGAIRGRSDTVSNRDLAAHILTVAMVVSALLSAQQQDRKPKAWVLWLELSLIGIGSAAVVGLMLYGLGFRVLPIEIVVPGMALAGALVCLRRRLGWLQGPAVDRDTVLVGYEPEMQALLDPLEQRLAGVVDADQSRVPAGVPYLGPPSVLLNPLPAWRSLVVSPRGLESLHVPSLLGEAQRRGIKVEDLAGFHQRTLHRVCCGLLRPVDLLFARGSLQTSPHAMAAQAIYNNVVGLSLLLLSLPVLLIAGIAVALFSGRGPVFELTECAGFQGIPFQMLRFRTRRWDGSGRPTAIGQWLDRLRLTNLPMFLNVIRGELALFGPRAVRLEFFERICELIPFYFHRSSVKPGIFGWSQLNLSREPLPDEVRLLEYDFYYIQRISPTLDLEILLQTIFRSSDAGAGEAIASVRETPLPEQD
jgi:lipopolysaccharide/colanic/teichoic acid biosynthesis glycosyltransferase